ncbi:MAG: hypothetical protein PUF50_05535 [Erysipelotrichaceae bacterium]|nr:hypothetical protein [Erysipelotrichaceae bacterium]
MITFILCTAFGLFAFQQFSKPYFETRKKFKDMSEGRNLTCIDRSQKMVAFYVTGIVISAVVLVYSVLNWNTLEWAEIGLSAGSLLILILTSKVLATSVFHKIYYDEESIIYIDQIYRIKGIKNITPVKRSYFKVELNLYNGRTIYIPKKIGIEIQKILNHNKKK